MTRNLRLLVPLLLLVVTGCATRHPQADAGLSAVAQGGDPLAIADALEVLIEQGKDTQADREFALQQIQALSGDSAAYHFARASVTGRVVQGKGLLGATQLLDAEAEARRSVELDPDFRGGAATRMLGTLYVIAPARLLKHGDSEVGLELLETLTEKHPDVMENHLRLAEAYMMLHDSNPARPHLCIAQAGRGKLRLDDQQLLDRLLRETAPLVCE